MAQPAHEPVVAARCQNFGPANVMFAPKFTTALVLHNFFLSMSSYRKQTILLHGIQVLKSLVAVQRRLRQRHWNLAA